MMARPEIVLEFLQFRGLLVFVMGRARRRCRRHVLGASRSGRSAPLTGKRFGRRLKSMDRDVIVGGGSSAWDGALGDLPGCCVRESRHRERRNPLRRRRMFLGAYLQGYLREARSDAESPASAD